MNDRNSLLSLAFTVWSHAGFSCRSSSKSRISEQRHEIDESARTPRHFTTVGEPCLEDFFHTLLGMKADLIPQRFRHVQFGHARILPGEDYPAFSLLVHTPIALS
jgi:hypothetical protein